ncbi:MAG: protein-glutamate methylesterase/protein-glutamine glutaminase [Alphaproteobacteria bacterium]
MTNSDKISVALVDDSSVIRGVLSRILEADPKIEIVASVADGKMGVTIAGSKKPDILILDVEMPVMDGLTALPQILKNSPKTKVIMFSSLTAKGADTTLKAFSAGAVECLVKPTSAQGTGPGSEFQKVLLNLVKTLGGVSPSQPAPRAQAIPTAATPASPAVTPAKTVIGRDSSKVVLLNDPMAYRGKPKIIAIGSSTGGPQALFKVIKNIGIIDIPIVITQHMPATFTKILAEHITQHTNVPAHEGEDGMLVEAGNVYVAPGGKHMLFEQSGGQLRIKLDDGPAENFCKPAVDPMMRSLVDIYQDKILCVILTGMGQDGLLGAQALVEKKGRVIAQDEESSVIWGMPGAVAVQGLCHAVLPVDDVGKWIKKASLL